MLSKVEDKELMNDQEDHVLVAACANAEKDKENNATQDTVVYDGSSPVDTSNEKELMKLLSGHFDD